MPRFNAERLREASPLIGRFPIHFNSLSVDDAITACGTLPPVVAGSSNVGDTAIRDLNAGDVTYHVVEQQRQIVNDIVEHAFLQDVGQVTNIWPGAVIQGKALLSGDISPVGPLRRAPGTIVVVTDIITNNPQAQNRAVNAPDLASVTQARQDLLLQLDPESSAGMLKTDYQQAYTYREVGVKLGLTVKGSAFGVDANASLNQTYTKTTTVAVVRQTFYTVGFTPSGPVGGGIFDNSVTANDLKPYIGFGNPPLFVDSVHYGRFICVSVQGGYSSSEITAYLKATVTGSTSGSLTLDARMKEITTNSEVKIYTLGVPGFKGFQTLRDPLNELDQVFKGGLNLSRTNPGAPIAFTCRHISDATLAHVGLAAMYVQPISVSADDVDRTFAVWDGPGGGLVDTGIVVAPGDEVTISASGQAYSGVVAVGTHGPEGWLGWDANAAAPKPDGTANCLIINRR